MTALELHDAQLDRQAADQLEAEAAIGGALARRDRQLALRTGGAT